MTWHKTNILKMRLCLPNSLQNCVKFSIPQQTWREREWCIVAAGETTLQKLSLKKLQSTLVNSLLQDFCAYQVQQLHRTHQCARLRRPKHTAHTEVR